MSKHIEIFGTTTHPCPDWGTLPAGHGYDSTVIATDNLFRVHVGHGDDLHIRGLTGDRDYTISVELEAGETATPDGRQVIEIQPVTMSISGYRERTGFNSADPGGSPRPYSTLQTAMTRSRVRREQPARDLPWPARAGRSPAS